MPIQYHQQPLHVVLLPVQEAEICGAVCCSPDIVDLLLADLPHVGDIRASVVTDGFLSLTNIVENLAVINTSDYSVPSTWQQTALYISVSWTLVWGKRFTWLYLRIRGWQTFQVDRHGFAVCYAADLHVDYSIYSDPAVSCDRSPFFSGIRLLNLWRKKKKKKDVWPKSS